MAEHRAGIAKAEIGEAMAVDIGQPCARGFRDDEREWQGPIAHPMHRDAVIEPVGQLASECLRPRMMGFEPRRFLGVETLGSVGGRSLPSRSDITAPLHLGIGFVERLFGTDDQLLHLAMADDERRGDDHGVAGRPHD